MSSTAQQNLLDGMDIMSSSAETLVLSAEDHQTHPGVGTQLANDNKPPDTSLTECADRIGAMGLETIPDPQLINESVSIQYDHDSLRQPEWTRHPNFYPSSDLQQGRIGEHKPPVRSRFGFLLDEDVSAPVIGMDFHQTANLYQQACGVENGPSLPTRYTNMMGLDRPFPSMQPDSLANVNEFSRLPIDTPSSSIPISGPVIHSNTTSINDWPFWSPRPLGHELMGDFVPNSSMQYGSRFVDFSNEQRKEEPKDHTPNSRTSFHFVILFH
jgi:hypothetical protein